MTASPTAAARPRWRLPWLVALCVFLGLAAFYLWAEHRAHLLGALPYLLFLLCPLIHLLGHRGGHAHGSGAPDSAQRHGDPCEGEKVKRDAP